MTKHNTSTTTVCIEVLATSTIDNLTSVIQTATREALSLDTDTELSDSVDTVVTGITPSKETQAIFDAVSTFGLDPDTDLIMFQPNTERMCQRIAPELFNDERAFENRAYREATDLRNKSLADGAPDFPAADAFILITDDITHSDVHGLTAGANAFIDSITDYGRDDDLHVSYVGVPTEENAPVEGSEPPADDNNVFLGDKVTVPCPPCNNSKSSSNNSSSLSTGTSSVTLGVDIGGF